MSKESGVFVGSLNAQGEEISLSGFLEREVLRGRITEIQLAFGGSYLTTSDLARIAHEAFGSNIPPEVISIESGGFNDRDLFFVEQFGFKLLPRFARLKSTRGFLSHERIIEAWAKPVLVPPKHPLAHTADQNAVVFITEPNMPLTREPSFMVPFGFGAIAPPHYLRLTVLDEPLVLSEICQVFGNNNINIRAVRQPEPLPSSPSAELAFILDSCQSIRFEAAQEAIRKLNVCLRIDAVLPIIA